jgi:hypothetical protein
MEAKKAAAAGTSKLYNSSKQGYLTLLPIGGGLEGADVWGDAENVRIELLTVWVDLNSTAQTKNLTNNLQISDLFVANGRACRTHRR